jgi:hypothetical protein
MEYYEPAHDDDELDIRLRRGRREDIPTFAASRAYEPEVSVPAPEPVRDHIYERVNQRRSPPGSRQGVENISIPHVYARAPRERFPSPSPPPIWRSADRRSIPHDNYFYGDAHESYGLGHTHIERERRSRRRSHIIIDAQRDFTDRDREQTEE